MLIKKYDFSITKLNNMNETDVQNSMLEVLANNYILISNNEEFNESTINEVIEQSFNNQV